MRYPYRIVGVSLFFVFLASYWAPLVGQAIAQPTRAQLDASRAEQLAAEAFKAYQKKQFAEAVSLYRKAYDLVPAADILFNIARIYDNGLRDRSLAGAFYRHYIADPGATPDRVRKANERLIALKAAEAEALAPQNAANYERPDTPPPSPVPLAAKPRRSAGPSALSWTLSGLGVVGLGAGAVLGVLAASNHEDASSSCSGNQCASQAGVDSMESAYKYGNLSTIALASGGLLFATGLSLWLFGGRDSPAENAGLALAPAVGMRSVGTQLVGSW